MSLPIDHSSLIAALGGGSDVASGLESVGAEVRALPVNVRAWAARNRIPPEYWSAQDTATIARCAADGEFDAQDRKELAVVGRRKIETGMRLVAAAKAAA